MKTTPVYLNRLTERYHFFAHLVACLVFPVLYSKVKKIIQRQTMPEGCKVPVPALVYDMLYSKFAFGTNYRRYRIFAFWSKNDYGKAQFVSCDRHRIFRRIGVGEARKVFGDKFETYSQFQDFYGRDAIKVTLPQERKSFVEFVAKHGSFIIKPLCAMQGNGVQVFNTLSSEEVNSILSRLADGEYILEELITQDKQMAVLHPSSVNTIRFVTYYNKGNLVKLYAMLRMGIGNSCVDNACAGGICAGIDMESGIVLTQGMRQNGEHLLRHPDTGQIILGFHIPKWDELQIFIEKLVQVNPKIKYAGWDVALSEKGWCVVEGNSTPSFQGFQMCMGKGIANQVNDLLVLDDKIKHQK